MRKDILFFVEQLNGKVKKNSIELASGAKRLALQSGGRAIAFLAGYGIHSESLRLLEAGADLVLTVDSSALTCYSSCLYTEAMKQAVHQVKPSLILFTSDAIGIDLASSLSAVLDIGLVTDCTELKFTEDETACYRMVRPNKDGSMIDVLHCPNADMVAATVRPGILTSLSKEDAKRQPIDFSNAVINLQVSFSSLENQVELLGTEVYTKEAKDIIEASVIVAGGRGIGSAEGFKNLQNIAKLLDGTVACSRACVESGWMDAAFQVGQSGKTVRPDLYLACGISGAFQHITGMSDSKLIISINKNPAAPIFDISDLGIVGDVKVILPRLIEALEKHISSF